MKRSFTSLIAVSLLLATSSTVFSQCLTGGSFTAAATYTFDANSQNFTGDFNWVSSGSGELESTPVSVNQTKVLTTPTFFLPNSATTIAWSFNLAGTANVTAYTVDALYMTGSGVTSVQVCTGGALTTTGSNLIFAASAPSQIVGTNFQLRITFTSTSTGSKVLTVDNFRTNAGASQIALPVTFSYINAAAASGAIKLTWLVSTELNVNRYEVERSSNGKTFSRIGSVNASGVVTYTYSDAAYQTGSNYYRIKAVDNDGSYKYSKVVLFKVGKNTLLSTLKVYPVPATNELTVKYDATSKISTIDLLSVDGKTILTTKPVAGSTQTAINISSLKAGLYLIKYTVADEGTETLKIIKQ